MGKVDDSNLSAGDKHAVMQGTFILFLSWLMFNGASTLGMSGEKGKTAQLAMINTILAGCSSGIMTFATKKYIVGGMSGA